jgi:amino acid transporter
MAESQLFPRFLKKTYGEHKTPHAALIAGSIIGYVVCLLVYFFPAVGGYIFNICVLSAFMAYISQFYGFIFMKFRHSNQKRDFHNPLGYVGAVYGALVFTFAAISVIGFQGDGHVAFIAFLVQVGVLSLYYYSYARKRQCFSDDEKFVFIAQIIKCKSVSTSTLRIYSYSSRFCAILSNIPSLQRHEHGLQYLTGITPSH